MTMFYHDIDSIELVDKKTLIWCLVEQGDGKLENQIVITDDKIEDEDKVILWLSINTNDMRRAREVWNNLTYIVNLLKGKE